MVLQMNATRSPRAARAVSCEHLELDAREHCAAAACLRLVGGACCRCGRGSSQKHGDSAGSGETGGQEVVRMVENALPADTGGESAPPPRLPRHSPGPGQDGVCDS